MKNVVLCILTILTYNLSLIAQIERVEPPFWWTGMNNSNLQLLVYGENIGSANVSLENTDVVLKKVRKADSPNYLFIDLVLPQSTKPETIAIQFELRDGSITNLPYELKARNWDPKAVTGFSSADVMYLITPDRFANGDPSNDAILGMREELNRTEPFGRHGGDIRGIINGLDYIDSMGFTAIWLNPILENNQDKSSYHGYATTDYYKVDPRFGSNTEYLELSKKAREKGIGLVMDIIVNHCGHQHWWANDLPFLDWYNQMDTSIMYSNHRKETLLDPYVSVHDRQQMVEGWFVKTMPDLNQRNPYLSTYLIQNTIWWIEYAKLYGVRQDTYSYPFREFMTDWTCAIMNEYPNFNIVGEEWIDDPAVIAYWQQGKINADGYTSCLRSLMDFPLTFNLHKALNEEEGFTTGLIKIYQSLSRDFHYADANELVVFPDNHDMSRVYTQLNEDFDKFKMAIGFILTTRGVPQLFYGTEVIMSHPGTDSHGVIRSDFPGGWEGDTVNVFTRRGLNAKQREAQEFCRNLLNWRKSKKVIHSGKLKHFAPKEGIYVYFRYNEAEKVMVVINKNDQRKKLPLDAYDEMGVKGQSFYNIADRRRIAAGDHLMLEANSISIYEIN